MEKCGDGTLISAFCAMGFSVLLHTLMLNRCECNTDNLNTQGSLMAPLSEKLINGLLAFVNGNPMPYNVFDLRLQLSPQFLGR